MVDDQSKPTDEHIKKLLANSKPDEKSKAVYDEYCCVICLLFAYDPVLCSQCNVTICKNCNDQNIW